MDASREPALTSTFPPPNAAHSQINITMDRSHPAAAGGARGDAAEANRGTAKRTTFSVPSWQLWYKPLSGGSFAVFFANHHPAAAASFKITFSTIPGVGRGSSFDVTDVWQHTTSARASKAWTFDRIQPRDSSFLVLDPRSIQ